MDRYQDTQLSGRAEHGGKDDEERLGLLGKDEEQSDLFSDIEELDWEGEVKTTQHHQPRKKSSWFRIVVVCLLVAWTVGFIVHSFLIPHRKDALSSTPAAQLRPEEDYILDPDWDAENAQPTTREYNWTIAEHDLNPDGVYRPMILINGMFPGPLIECNEGDEIVVHVHNRASNATSIHWHGLFQNGTNWMDGTVGVTQCTIAPGHDFTYRFKVQGQSGTYWYHSHMSMQASDGLVGPLVIHSKDEEKLQKVQYGSDRVVLVSDHYYDLSSSLMMQYLAPDSENNEPVPPSAVINGRNTRDCSALPNRNCSSTNITNALFDLPSDQNTRLRFINVGAFAEFQIQIDEHEFLVTEVDGTDVYPQYIHRLNIAPAQRYSVILVPPLDHNKGLYWLRARMITHCFAYENPELQEEVRGVIKYWAPGDSQTPTSLDWPDIIEVQCRDLNTSSLSPVRQMRAPEQVDDHIYLRSSFQIRDWRLSRGFLNDSSYRTHATSPSLNRLVADYTRNQKKLLHPVPSGVNSLFFHPDHELVYQTTGIRVVDILIQNFDDGNHPFHLHGHQFFVLASGHGYPAADLKQNLSLENPPRRDTVSVEGFGWTLIRFVADNPGIWSFHCHIGWHSEAGLLMQFLTRADDMATWELPADVKALCDAPGIEKGMGPDDSIWVGS